MSTEFRAVTHPVAPHIFQFEANEVRTVEKDGEVWFVGRDVAAALGYAKPEGAISSHCKHAKSFASLDLGETPCFSGATYNMLMIPERDVFRLIMKSTLPGAEKFEEWVVSEVLPSIRKHGNYCAAPNLPALPQSPMEMFLLAADAIKDLNSRTLQIESRTSQIEDVALEAVQKSEHAVTTVDDFLATRPLTHTQCYEIRLAVEKKKQQLTEKYSIPSGGTVYSGLYSFLKHHFRVNTYTGIPSARYDEALMIINNITLDQLPDNVKNAVPKAKAKKGGAK
jgi:prophage antirepressor-like protein